MRPYFRSPLQQTGWTLLEVIVALVIMASLSALGYRGVSILMTTENQLREESERLVAIDNAFTQMDADWNAQYAQLPNPSQPADTQDSNQPSTGVENPTQWTITPINGWIPAAALGLRAPPALETILAHRYTVSYRAHAQGGVERTIGCASTSSTTASFCQHWHVLTGLPSHVENTSTPTQGKHAFWRLTTPHGIIERLWSFQPIAALPQ